LSPKLISIPRVLAVSAVGESVTGDVHKNVERLRQRRSKTAEPIGAKLAKTCRDWRLRLILRSAPVAKLPLHRLSGIISKGV
jgi:hypothetical protein